MDDYREEGVSRRRRRSDNGPKDKLKTEDDFFLLWEDDGFILIQVENGGP
jgi:hypothetical protein